MERGGGGGGGGGGNEHASRCNATNKGGGQPGIFHRCSHMCAGASAASERGTAAGDVFPWRSQHARAVQIDASPTWRLTAKWSLMPLSKWTPSLLFLFRIKGEGGGHQHFLHVDLGSSVSSLK